MKNLDFIQTPGEVLREELEARDITQKDFAGVIWKSVSELSELINAKRWLTASWAILLSEALGVSAEFWLSLQKDYELAQTVQKTRVAKLERVRENAKKFPSLQTI